MLNFKHLGVRHLGVGHEASKQQHRQAQDVGIVACKGIVVSSYLVWLLLEGFIHMCTCFHLEISFNYIDTQRYKD